MPLPYGPVTGGYGNNGTSGGPNSFVDCANPITTVFTWQPDDPGDIPPLNVILQETSTATWGGLGSSAPTGSCDDGIGDKEVDTPSQIGSSLANTGASSGVRYKVSPGGATVTVTCTPTAHANTVTQTIQASVAYAFFDFTTPSDVEQWLARH